MTIKPSTALRNEYLQISAMAKASGEPIYITNKGEADGVFMSVEAFEQREKMLAHRAVSWKRSWHAWPDHRRIHRMRSAHG